MPPEPPRFEVVGIDEFAVIDWEGLILGGVDSIAALRRIVEDPDSVHLSVWPRSGVDKPCVRYCRGRASLVAGADGLILAAWVDSG